MRVTECIIMHPSFVGRPRSTLLTSQHLQMNEDCDDEEKNKSFLSLPQGISTKLHSPWTEDCMHCVNLHRDCIWSNVASYRRSLNKTGCALKGKNVWSQQMTQTFSYNSGCFESFNEMKCISHSHSVQDGQGSKASSRDQNLDSPPPWFTFPEHETISVLFCLSAQRCTPISLDPSLFQITNPHLMVTPWPVALPCLPTLLPSSCPHILMFSCLHVLMTSCHYVLISSYPHIT